MKLLSGLSGVFTGGMSCGYSAEVSARLGVPADFFEEHRKIKEPGFWQVCRGRVSEEEFFADLAESWNCKCVEQLELMGDDLRDVMYEVVQRPIDGTVDVLSRILYYPEYPGKGGRVLDGPPKFYIVEDQTAEIVPMLYQWYPDAFWLTEGEMWSFAIGAIKRDPGFFKLVMSTLGGRPEEYLLIDSIEANLQEAERRGIKTILFKDPDQLEQELSQYGFAFSPKY